MSIWWFRRLRRYSLEETKQTDKQCVSATITMRNRTWVSVLWFDMQFHSICNGSFHVVWLFRKLFKNVQSVYRSQKLYPCVLNTFFKNCASVYTNNLLYKYEKNQCSLASGNCHVINRGNWSSFVKIHARSKNRDRF